MYEVIIEKKADKYLSTIPSGYQERIKEKIDGLASNPFPHGYKSLRRLNVSLSIALG